MPYAGTVGGEVDLSGMVGIHDGALAPMKVVALYFFPGLAIVVAAIGGLVERVAIQSSRVMDVHGDIVYILCLIKNRGPGIAGVFRHEYTAWYFYQFIASGRTCNSPAHKIGQVEI